MWGHFINHLYTVQFTVQQIFQQDKEMKMKGNELKMTGHEWNKLRWTWKDLKENKMKMNGNEMKVKGNERTWDEHENATIDYRMFLKQNETNRKIACSILIVYR